jgi:predicted glycoside hydrolase/deacetylase ChbG (UPF0249 family)
MEIPSHVDGHQHIQSIPEVADLLSDVMSNYFGIYQVRLPIEEIWNETINSKRREFYSEIYNQCLISKKIYESKQIINTHKFIGMNIMGQDCNDCNFSQCLENLRDKDITIEYMCHPVNLLLLRDIIARIIGMTLINQLTEIMN